MTEEKSEKRNLALIAGGVGAIVGLIGGMIICYNTPIIQELKLYQREQKPSVIRVYKKGMDEILVETFKDTYQQLENHLSSFQDKADKEVEEAEIKKIVEWYRK